MHAPEQRARREAFDGVFEPNPAVLQTVHMQANVTGKVKHDSVHKTPVCAMQTSSQVAMAPSWHATDTEKHVSPREESASCCALPDTRVPGNPRGHVAIIAVLFVCWVGLVIIPVVDIPETDAAVFAWVWAPAVLVQMALLNTVSVYMVLNLFVYVLLTSQVAQMLGFSYTDNLNMGVSIALLVHQVVVHIVLNEGLAFPVWVFVLTAVLCVCARVWYVVDDDMFYLIQFLYNAYLFALLMLSMLMYHSHARVKVGQKVP